MVGSNTFLQMNIAEKDKFKPDLLEFQPLNDMAPDTGPCTVSVSDLKQLQIGNHTVSTVVEVV